MTNRMDNLTTDERLAASIPPRKNYFISQCCSVDDLRGSLRCTRQPHNAAARNEMNDDLTQAIEHEKKGHNRVTIINMLDAKRRQIAKLSFVFIAVIFSSCGRHQVIVWDGTDLIGIAIFGVLLLALFVLWVINIIAGIIDRKRYKGR